MLEIMKQVLARAEVAKQISVTSEIEIRDELYKTYKKSSDKQTQVLITWSRLPNSNQNHWLYSHTII
jgi:hypothetical protein